MPVRIQPTIKDDKIVKLYQDEIEKKYGSTYIFFGKELEEAIKLHLTIKYGVIIEGDQSIDQLLDTYLGVTHTQTVNTKLDHYEKQDLNHLLDPERCKTKTQRAYVTLNHLKKVHLEQFTQRDYEAAMGKLFEQSDYRTIKSNLELLELHGVILKEQMRLGKKNRAKQVYSFYENKSYLYKNENNLDEFTKLFKEEYVGGQVTLSEIKLFLDNEVLVNSEEFVKEYADILVKDGVIEEFVRSEENGTIIFNVK